MADRRHPSRHPGSVSTSGSSENEGSGAVYTLLERVNAPDLRDMASALLPSWVPRRISIVRLQVMPP